MKAQLEFSDLKEKGFKELYFFVAQRHYNATFIQLYILLQSQETLHRNSTFMHGGKKFRTHKSN